MDCSKLVCGSLFLHLLILMVVHQSGATQIDIKKWSKITVANDQHVSKQRHLHYHEKELDTEEHEHKQNENTSDFPMVDSVAKETNVLRLHSMDVHDDQENDKKDDAQVQEMQTRHVHAHADHHDHSSSHTMNHMDPSTIVFFLLDDLKLGKTMPIYFPDRDPPSSSSPHSLPKEEADAIPFSLQLLPNLLQLFSFSQGSPQAIAIEDTLRQCGIDPIKGEIKFCATSYESMLNFAQEILGVETIRVLSTVHLTRLAARLQEYTIIQVPQQISAPRMVACHTMPYPYTVFYCHYQESESRVYRIALSGENGERVDAIAVCHLDTSQWSPNHVSFTVLGIEPGTSPVCHFFPADNFVSVPSTSSN